jgi:uncharacterized membrane protein
MALQEKYYRGAFVGVNIFKGAEAVVQIVLGFLLLFTTTVTRAILFLTDHELIEDPTDFIASHVQALLQSTPHIQLFAGLYMLAFGTLKLFLIWGLLTKRLWTYPAALTFIGVVFIYQAANLFETHPILLAYLSLLDIIFAWLTWHEYQFLKGQKNAAQA